MKRKLRLYLDTSVFGGYFDEEFSDFSRPLMDGLFHQKAILLASSVVVDELAQSPQQVKSLLQKVPENHVEFVPLSNEVKILTDLYIQRKVVTKKSLNDAIHVALATISRADAIISWNFKHIVRLDRIKGFNQVNLEMGYREIVILSPMEVRFDE